MSPVFRGVVWVVFFPLSRVPFLVCRGWSFSSPYRPGAGRRGSGDGGKIQADIDPGPRPMAFSQWHRSSLVPSARVSQPQISLPVFSRNRDMRRRTMIKMAMGMATTRKIPQATGKITSMAAGNGRAGIWVLRRGLDLLPQLGENRPQAGDEFLHGFLLFSGRQGRPAERVFRGYPLAPGCHPQGKGPERRRGVTFRVLYHTLRKTQVRPPPWRWSPPWDFEGFHNTISFLPLSFVSSCHFGGLLIK